MRGEKSNEGRAAVAAEIHFWRNVEQEEFEEMLEINGVFEGKESDVFDGWRVEWEWRR